ncbi:uncharacterized protein LOC141601547 [Silene latifolia]|uniref:uncharacterized protein LOC141601547 n=1 Tax=Silene latifolia TaxID=37657 RepID=UPI003D78AED9
MRTEWSLKVKEEIDKQLKAGFIKVSEYSDWVANVVLVPKKDGKVRVCVDFRDLNKASPKDDFPLPHIDMLVDNTANHALLSFMDGPPIAGLPLSLYLTVTDTALGEMLAQTVEKEERAIYYISKKFIEYEAEFDLKYVPLKAVKGRTVADFLADNPIEEDSVTDMWSFPDENVVHVEDELDFLATNNAAKYEACLLGLRSAISLNIKKLLVHGDSSLVINQITGSWKIKSNSLAPYQPKIEELEKYYEEIHYVHLPREENQFTDALSKLAALVNIPDHIKSMPLCVE